jgi:hypothetical protein
MTPEEFKAKRDELNMTQQELADALGLAIRTVQYYEACGPRYADRDVKIPGPVQLLIAKLRPKRKREAANAV